MFLEIHYADHFPMPLPEGHPFPVAKYPAVRRALEDDRRSDVDRFIPAAPASIAAISRAHDREYVARWIEGRAGPDEVRVAGFPWSDDLMLRTRASVGATLGAVNAARRWGVGCSLAGGTHHAHRDRASGYCIFNDLAIAALTVLAENDRERVLIVDLDVHQGDGTASILADEHRVFTFSMHGAKNFPRLKTTSTRDIALPDGADDAFFLARLEDELREIGERFPPTFILYQAGVDVLAGDKLGRLAIMPEGLARRDRLVFAAAKRFGAPIASVLGGGYGRDLEKTIRGHAEVVRAAREIFFT